jgi:hypothetical protein
MVHIVRRCAGLLATNSAVLLFLSAANAGDADKSAVGFEAKPVLKTTETNVGGPLKYPATGKPELSSAIVKIQPGGRSTSNASCCDLCLCPGRRGGSSRGQRAAQEPRGFRRHRGPPELCRG